jgi:glycerophosphoryl diester phosphodiesterase
LTETTGSEIRSAGLACYVRAGDDPGSLERLNGWDVDGIITARPSLVRTRLGR